MIFSLIKSPCGCVIDATKPRSPGPIVECPWCGATFMLTEAQEWSAAGMYVPIWFERGPLLLIRQEERLLEAVAQCNDCGAPFVRERGKRMKPYHLETNKVEVLRN